MLYAALFCVALMGILATSYAAVAGNAERLVREQMQATGAVFDRIWDVRFEQLQYGARLSVRDYGFRQAVATQDDATIRSALENLRGRLGADLVFLGTPDGRVLGGESAARIPVTQNLLDALEGDGAVTGVRPAPRTKLAFFDETAYGDPARNLSLMGKMWRALARGEIYLVHQPKLDLRRNVIDGVETLVRWRHPTRGMISPDLFVPIAAETGHIRALTDWVLLKAIEEQKQLAAAGWPLTVSVNISGRLLGDRDFAKSALRAVATAAHALCFEITETAIIENPKVALENIALFVECGVCVAIDDYGSGLSSLAYLKQLPASELKIDKIFIESLTDSQRDALLVRSTSDLAHGLGLRVTAEGVENPTAFALLAAMGCDMAQGYLVGRPCPVTELLKILNDRRRVEFFKQAAQSGGSPPSAISA